MKPRYVFNTFSALVVTLALTFMGATGAMALNGPDICGTPQVETLWGGKTINVGTVTVSNDEENLYVTYATTNDWLLTEVQLYVLYAEPTSRLPPGQAPYKSGDISYATTYTFTVPLPDTTVCGETALWLQAHASVVKLDNNGDVIDEETAYGGEITHPDRGAWYGNIKYVVRCCDSGGDECVKEETAWGGATAGLGNAWWFYYDTLNPAPQTIWAGQTINVGTVTVLCNEICTITINLTGEWGLQAGNETVKIQGYDAGAIPTARPAPGQFTTFKGTALEVNVAKYPFYAIHLDVGTPAGCDPK